MFKFGYITKEHIIEHNPNWPEIPDHPYRILIIGGSGSGKTNALLNLINHVLNIDNIYLYSKINTKQNFYSKNMKMLEQSILMIQKLLLNIQTIWMIKDYDPNKKRKILIVFDDMIADMLSNKKLNPIVTELFIRGRKLNISLVFITQSYFAVPKNIRLNSTHYFVMKIPNKRELQQIAFNHSSDIDFQDFMNLYIKSTAKPYSFLVIDTTLPSDNSLRFRKNLLEAI